MILKITKCRLIIAMVLLVALVASLLFSSYRHRTAAPALTFPERKELLIIDAGHGGFDGGAVAKDGTFEKDLNLAVALKLSEQARAVGINTLMIRETDDAVGEGEEVTKLADMKNRLKIINEHEGAVFVSIHMNEFSTAQPQGAQVFFAPSAKGSSELADLIQKSIARDLQRSNKRLAKKATKDVFLLYYAHNTAVVVECGFLSNSDDLHSLQNEEYQSKLAFSILRGILEYYSR